MTNPQPGDSAAPTALRILVTDVDAALPAWQQLGYTVRDRWGPPFAILSGPGIDVWLSGPETSAAQICEGLDPAARARAATRLVTITDSFDARVGDLQAAGWDPLTSARSGPGGRQVLLQQGETILECFSPR